jgi:hypothetical protein
MLEPTRRVSRHLPAAVALLNCWLMGSTLGQLPADGGQVWKTYDVSPFVEAAGSGSEQHIVNWILHRTGYTEWHGEMAASLSATGSKLSCYHTPDMQADVASIVQRFTAAAGTPHRFQVRVIGLGSVRWRGVAREKLTPIAASTPGVQAWIVPREASAPLLAKLLARNDVEELPIGPVLASNGVPASLAGTRERTYVKDFSMGPGVPGGWQPLESSCHEGLSVDVQPLLEADGTTVEAVIRCHIDQIEKMVPVSVTIPAGNRPTVRLEVPQIAAVRIGERFRWPVSRTLIVGLGLVPWPVPGQNAANASSLFTQIKRTDAIVIVEPRLRSDPAPNPSDPPDAVPAGGRPPDPQQGQQPAGVKVRYPQTSDSQKQLRILKGLSSPYA